MDNLESIKALVRLIDDPDENVYSHVREELIRLGPRAIPFLEHSWEAEDYGLTFQSRIEQLIHDIQFKNIKEQLNRWIASPDKDLLSGALIVNQYQFPNLDDAVIRDNIQAIRKDIWLELNNLQTAYEKVRVFNKVFYGKHLFTGNTKDYNAPMNSYISSVLETKKGNPLTLSVIYSVLAQSLDMPVYGVNLPNHFILVYLDENGTNEILQKENNYGALFYINVFSRGSIFDENEIRSYLKGIHEPELREYFEPCSNSTIIKRMLNNLINAYSQIGNNEKSEELTELRDLFDTEL